MQLIFSMGRGGWGMPHDASATATGAHSADSLLENLASDIRSNGQVRVKPLKKPARN